MSTGKATTILLAVLAAADAQTARTRQVLAEGWVVKQLDAEKPDIARLTREAAAPDDTWLRARMPAQVHDILLENRKIPDPHIGRNAAASAWVGEKDWVYACKFKSPARKDGPVFLRFGGLDTLAAAYLNGAAIGSFDNMYREYAVDVRKQLAADGQDNLLLIVFSSPLRFIDRVQQPAAHVNVIPKFKYLRKSHADFSPYLAPRRTR